MIYPSDFETITGFVQIREMLVAFCRFETSAEIAMHHKLMHEKVEIEKSFNEADEYIALQSVHPDSLDFTGTEDISKWLFSLDVENYFYEEDQLFSIKNTVETYVKVYKYLNKHKDIYPVLNSICGNIEFTENIVTIIRGVIDLKGNILPYASANFGKINSEIEKLEKDARQVVRSIFRQWKDAGYTSETDITVRDERLVIPVQAEHKRHVKGFVKDVSATGKVVYIEPLESLELNNRLKELYFECRREKENILRTTTAKLKPYKITLTQMMESLTQFDWISARVSLFKKTNAERPKLQPKPYLEFKNGVNPLLWLKNKSTKTETVSMDVQLGGENKIMVISGPNAGGKSITLKTVLLLQYMGQCGLFITANPESTIGIFQNYAVDCGDGQSLDEGLSTFSAHLKHLKKMTTIAGPNSLFGVDELGDGTDPRFGGPIAQAVLEDFLASGAIGVITTHYSRLKEWAGQTKMVTNASMAYDTRELKPLYKLVTGKPGSSFALELLKKTGFNKKTIERIEGLSGEESKNTEELLIDLEEKQRDLNELLEENRRKESQLTVLKSEYTQLKDKIEFKKKEILDGAKNKASSLLTEANKKIELTIRTIIEHSANKEVTAEARKKLKQFEENKINIKEENISTKLTQNMGLKIEAKNTPTIASKKIKWLPGMQVRNKLNNGKGEILEIKKDKFLVSFGLLKMWVSEKEIEVIEGNLESKQRKSLSGFNWVERQSEFSPTIDIRGMRGEEGLLKVQNWMDEAYVLGQNKLKIIHGRGDGILRKMLREYFKTLHFVKNYKSEHEEQGGDGCTLIELS